MPVRSLYINTAAVYVNALERLMIEEHQTVCLDMQSFLNVGLGIAMFNYLVNGFLFKCRVKACFARMTSSHADTIARKCLCYSG
jgi:hypothetical protein